MAAARAAAWDNCVAAGICIANPAVDAGLCVAAAAPRYGALSDPYMYCGTLYIYIFLNIQVQV